MVVLLNGVFQSTLSMRRATEVTVGLDTDL